MSQAGPSRDAVGFWKGTWDSLRGLGDARGWTSRRCDGAVSGAVGPKRRARCSVHTWAAMLTRLGGHCPSWGAGLGTLQPAERPRARHTPLLGPTRRASPLPDDSRHAGPGLAGCVHAHLGCRNRAEGRVGGRGRVTPEEAACEVCRGLTGSPNSSADVLRPAPQCVCI